MSQTGVYHIARLRGEGPAIQRLVPPLREQTAAAVERAGGQVWGIFTGLLGMDSRELLFVTHWRSAGEASSVTTALPNGARIADERVMVPTIRPLMFERRTRSGVYVFRWFEVHNRDVDEIAALSKDAWESFEDSDAYDAEPQALLRDADTSAADGMMLLITWYEDLRSWEISRNPAPEARANFAARAKLTVGAFPVATRLAD